MGQITIYVDAETETKMRLITKSMHISHSKWISNLIKEKIRNDWPKSVIELAGAWKDLPTIEEIRETEGTDVRREEF
jgi:hypothetical protein